MKRIGWLLIVGAAVPGMAWSQSEPGNRPDRSPLLFKLESKIIKEAGQLSALDEEFHQALLGLQKDYEERVADLTEEWRQAPRTGWPLLRDSKRDYERAIESTKGDYYDERDALKSRYGAQLEDRQGDFEALLATPPDADARLKIEQYRPYTASREQLELYNAALNLQAVANELTARLRADKANYELAVDTYDVMLELLTVIIEMNTGFIARCQHAYEKDAREILGRIDRAIEQTRNAKDVDPAIVERETAKLTAVRERMVANIPKLDKMQAWAEGHLASLEPILSTVRLLRDNAEVVRDAADWVSGIEESFSELDVSLPPLVEYDLVESDFELALPEDL